MKRSADWWAGTLVFYQKNLEGFFDSPVEFRPGQRVEVLRVLTQMRHDIMRLEDHILSEQVPF